MVKFKYASLFVSRGFTLIPVFHLWELNCARTTIKLFGTVDLRPRCNSFEWEILSSALCVVSYFRLNLYMVVEFRYQRRWFQGSMCFLEQKFSWSSDISGRGQSLGWGQGLLLGLAGLGAWASIRQQRESGHGGRGEAGGVLDHGPQTPLGRLEREHVIMDQLNFYN